MRVTSILFLLSATVGCTDAENTNKNEQGEVGSYSLSILSPEQDAQFEPGELVTLSVAVVSSTGDSMSLEQVSWETGDWLANGNNLSVSDLPEGSRSLNVTAVAMGDSFSGSVFAIASSTESSVECQTSSTLTAST